MQSYQFFSGNLKETLDTIDRISSVVKNLNDQEPAYFSLLDIQNDMASTLNYMFKVETKKFKELCEINETNKE